MLIDLDSRAYHVKCGTLVLADTNRVNRISSENKIINDFKTASLCLDGVIAKSSAGWEENKRMLITYGGLALLAGKPLRKGVLRGEERCTLSDWGALLGAFKSISGIAPGPWRLSFL